MAKSTAKRATKRVYLADCDNEFKWKGPRLGRNYATQWEAVGKAAGVRKPMGMEHADLGTHWKQV